MSNILNSGVVIPSSLYSIDHNSHAKAFNKTYANTQLRAGVIIKSYPIDSKDNLSKLAPEYDVVVIEQDADKAIVPLIYPRCISMEGLGSIADTFTKTYRSQTETKSESPLSTDFNGQDGAIVLVLCLDGVSQKAIILGGLRHPDAKPPIKGDEKQLYGEFNGLRIQVEDDGSAKLTFRGATDNKGNTLDPSQGDTTMDIEQDGSFQLKHKGVTQRLEKEGKYKLITEDNEEHTVKKSYELAADVNIQNIAKEDMLDTANNWLVNIKQSTDVKTNTLSILAQSDAKIESKTLLVNAKSYARVKAPRIVLDGFVNAGGNGGSPAIIQSTAYLGIGNLGLPVISYAIGPFSVKVTVV